MTYFLRIAGPGWATDYGRYATREQAEAERARLRRWEQGNVRIDVREG